MWTAGPRRLRKGRWHVSGAGCRHVLDLIRQYRAIKGCRV